MKCEIIRDLIPNYIEGLTSEESNYEIEKHLEVCMECSKCLEEMRQNIVTPKAEMQEKTYVQILKKIRKMEIERIVLFVSIIVMIVAMIYHSIDNYYYSMTDALHSELNIVVKSIENKRILFFNPKDEQWLITLGYITLGDDSENVKDGDKEPLFVLGPMKARKFDNNTIKTIGDIVPGVLYNRFMIEFVDENTYIDTSEFYNGDLHYVDFDEDDYIEIQFGIEKKELKLSDLYDGNIESLK